MNYNSGNFGGIIVVLENKINYKEEIKKCLNDMKSIKTFYKQIPNLLTFSRALFGPVVSILFLMGFPVAGVISTMLLFLTDMIDGKLARKWEVVSKFGADLDAFCDKIMFLGLSVPLLVGNPVIFLNFILEGVISLINVIGRINDLDTKTVFSGKVKTCLLLVMLGVGYLVQYLNVSVSFLNMLVGLTAVSQGVAISDYIKEYKRMNKIKKKTEKSIEIEKILSEDDSKKESEKSIIDELKYERDFILNSMDLSNEENVLVRKREYK